MERETRGSNGLKSTEEKEETDKQSMALIEAALYVAGRPLDLKTLGPIINTRSKRNVERVARMLMEEYRRRNTALEVLELEDERFVLQLKADHLSKVRRLALKPLLTPGPLKTLSYIAYRQPVSQKHVIEVRGAHAYAHIKSLRDMGLIECKKDGKTKSIKTTDYFADYFGLSHSPKTVKRQLGRIFNDLVKKDRENALQGNETVGAR